MAINYDELGKRISYFRARKGFSQETLGEKIGVNNKHISNIENRNREEPAQPGFPD